jgi:DNA modification methylase
VSEAAREAEPATLHSTGEVDGRSWELHHGDSVDVLPTLANESVDCVVTSPPYYWQRDYDVDGQFGMESTIDGYVDNMVRTFAALRDALKPTGTIFLNLGDTYYNAKGRPHGQDNKHRRRRMSVLRAVDGPGLGLPRKSLIGIPWRVALALQADGWILRSAITWVRKTSIPEPTAKDRPWRQSELVFLLTKNVRYYFNRDGLIVGRGDNQHREEDVWFIEPERNSIARGTHYAPYPRELVKRCIEVGCPEGGTVLDPFVGGGTTMSVALNRGRDAVGVELNEDFCDHIAKVLRIEAGKIPPSGS